MRLYDIFFDRAADSSGLSYWVGMLRNGMSLRDIAVNFSQSSEFQTKYANASTADYVEALYANLFERGSDAAGKAYWVEMIDSGKINRGDVALEFSVSAEAKSADGAATRFAESYLALRSAGTAEPSTAAVEALAKKSLAEAITEVQTIKGTVQNGIIQNANVIRDANGDGLPDGGTSTVTTDANGKFTIVGGYGDIVVTGGKDLTTGKTNDKVLSTTTNATNGNSGAEVMVTPLTTIINAIVNQGVSTADAVKKVGIALGLDTSVDLLTFNHTSKATATGATPADQKNAVAIKGAVAQLTMLMENTAGLIKGAAGSGTNLDATSITASVANALADKIITATANVTTPQSTALVALDSQDVIKEVVTGTATKVSAASTTPLTSTVVSKITDLSADAAKIISALNTTVKSTVNAINGASTFDASKVVDAFSTIAKTEGLAQDKVQTAITSGAESGSLSSAASSFTGSNLGTEIKSSVIGEIAGGVNGTSGGTVIDQVVTAPVSSGGGGGGGSTAPTFTVTESGTAPNKTIIFGGTVTGAVTLTSNGTNLTFTRDGIEATTKPVLADIAAGGVPAVTLTAAIFAIANLAVKLANNSATLNAVTTNVSEVIANIAKVKDASISAITLTAAELATNGVAAKLAANSATLNAVTTNVSDVIANIAKVKDASISAITLTAAELATNGVAAKLAANSATLNAVTTNVSDVIANIAKVKDASISAITLTAAELATNGVAAKLAANSATLNAVTTNVSDVIANIAKVKDASISAITLTAAELATNGVAAKLAANSATLNAVTTNVSEVIANIAKVKDASISAITLTAAELATNGVAAKLAADSATLGIVSDNQAAVVANIAKVVANGVTSITLDGAQFKSLTDATALGKLTDGGVTISGNVTDSAEAAAIVAGIAEIAAGGISAITLTAAQLATNGVAAKLAANSATLNAVTTNVSEVIANIAKVKDASISAITLTAAELATNGVAAKLAANSATLNAVTTNVSDVIANIAKVKDASISAITLTAAELATNGVAAKLAADSATLGIVSDNQAAVVANIAKVVANGVTSITLDGAQFKSLTDATALGKLTDGGVTISGNVTNAGELTTLVSGVAELGNGSITGIVSAAAAMSSTHFATLEAKVHLDATVTLADTGSAIATLADSAVNAKIDFVDATNDLISLTLARLNNIGNAKLVAGDDVTLVGLTNGDSLSATNVDKVATGNVALTGSAAATKVEVTGATGNMWHFAANVGGVASADELTFWNGTSAQTVTLTGVTSVVLGADGIFSLTVA